MTRRTGAALAVAALLLTGCAADVRGELRRDVAEITDDANARDAAGVRAGVEDLLERLDDAVASGELSSAEAARIAELARQLSERADLLEPDPAEEPTEAPSSSTTPEPVEEPTQEPTEEPVEEPTQEPTEEPVEEPTEEPTAEPEPTETLLPDVVPTG